MTQLESSEIKQLAFNLAQELTIQPRWLKLAVASKYSSICKGKLKTLATDKKIVGYKDKDSGRGDWIFDKESIDKYRLTPMTDLDIREKARRIFESKKLKR